MTAKELSDLAEQAASLSASQRMSAEDSVAQVVSGLGLNGEQSHRVKTMTNRKLLTRIKQSEDPHIWEQRFETAKGRVENALGKTSSGERMKTSSAATDTMVTKSTVMAGKKHPSDDDVHAQFESLLALASMSEEDREGTPAERSHRNRTEAATSLSEVLERELSPYRKEKTSSPWEMEPSYNDDLRDARREFHTGDLFRQILSPERRQRQAEEEFAKSSASAQMNGMLTAEHLLAETKAALVRAKASEARCQIEMDSAMAGLEDALGDVVEKAGLTPGEALYVTQHVLNEYPEIVQREMFSKVSAAILERYGIDPDAVYGEARDQHGNLAVDRIKTAQAQMVVRFSLEAVNEDTPSVQAIRAAADACTDLMTHSEACRVLETKCSSYLSALQDL